MIVARSTRVLRVMGWRALCRLAAPLLLPALPGLLPALPGLLPALPGVLAAQASPYEDFRPASDYILEVQGEADGTAEIYVSQQLPGFLCLSERLTSPVLVQPRGQQVHSVHIMKVAKQSDGSVDLLENPLLANLGSFEVVDMEIHFQAGGRPVVLKEKPPLLGLHGLDGMRSYSRDYVTTAAAYSPSEAAIEALRAQKTEVKVRVYFGSWCPFCQRYVPRSMRVAEALEGSAVRFDFYGLPRNLSSDPVSGQMGIKAVPTGVVWVGGKEAGRLNGDEWRNPELALNKIITR